MKKKPSQQEMISLNQELFSLDGDSLSVEELDQRLELAVATVVDDLICGTFGCGSFDSCGSFGCGSFAQPVNKAP
jgi:hypothetical protein